jgi:hypothetical protein
MDKSFIKQCSPEDAHRAGYLFGAEEIEREREFIQNNL